MTWPALDPEDAAIIQEIENERDRGGALVACQFLDNRLLQTIQTRLHRNDNIEGSLFRGKGGLASFSSRIDLGFLLQLYPNSTRDLMHRIRAVRNDFAHDLAPIRFTSPSVAARCNNIEELLDTALPAWLAFHSQLVSQCKKAPSETSSLPLGGWSLPALETPRDAYMGAIKIVLFFLMTARRVWEPERANLPASSQ